MFSKVAFPRRVRVCTVKEHVSATPLGDIKDQLTQRRPSQLFTRILRGICENIDPDHSDSLEGHASSTRVYSNNDDLRKWTGGQGMAVLPQNLASSRVILRSDDESHLTYPKCRLDYSYQYSRLR